MVSPEAIVHMRDITREMGFKEEPLGVTYQHPVICAMNIVEFPRGGEHMHTTTTKPGRVTCTDCLEVLGEHDVDLEEFDASY